MGSLRLDHYCAEIPAQTDQLLSHIERAGPETAVPTIPGWTLGKLLRHLGGAHRWTERIVRTRATGPVADDALDAALPYPDVPDAALRDWLAEGAERLSGTLREAGPEARVWTVAPGGTPVFWARRMTYETAVHRADAAAAAGVPYGIADAVGRDAVEEWLEFSTLPQAYPSPEARTALLAPGRALRLVATDVADGTGAPAPAGWEVDLADAAGAWRRTGVGAGTGTGMGVGAGAGAGAGERAGAVVRGPLADLVLLLYGRRTPADPALTVDGDAALLRAWLTGAGDWLRR